MLQKKLTIRQKLDYSSGEFASNIMFSAVSFYLMYFMINVAGLHPFYAALVFLISKLWDAVNDYLMGIVCEGMSSKYGDKRIFMLVGAIPFGVMFTLLWLVPNTSVQFYKFLYYFLAYCLFDTVWTMVYIPYNSLLANITEDYDERTSLNGWRVMVSNLGMILGAIAFPIFADGQQSLFYQLLGNEKDAYFFASLLFGLLGSIIMLYCAATVKEQKRVKLEFPPSPMKTLKDFWSMKEFRNTLLYYTLAMTAIDIVMGTYIFYLSDALNITNGLLISFFLGLPLATSAFSSFFWVKLSTRYDKSKAYTIAAIIDMAAVAFTLFIPEKGYIYLIVFGVVSGFATSGVQVIPFASIPDVVEADEYYNNIRRETSYFGVVQFAYNLASGLSLTIISVLLGTFGYVEHGTESQLANFVQPDSALIAIRVIIGCLPIITLIASIIFSRRTNIDRRRFNEMKLEIAKRKTN